MNSFTEKALVNWKSTVQGILTALLGTTGPLAAFLAALQAIKQAANQGVADYRYAIWGAGLTCVAAILKVWIGLISNDAKPAVTSSVTIESTAPANVTPVVVSTKGDVKP